MSEVTVMPPGNGDEEERQLPATRPRMEVSSPIDMDPAQFSAALDRRKANRNVLMDWIRSALVEGVDFGSIPTKRGPSKKSLWKAGAEKICGMLNVTAVFPTLADYEKAALAGVEIKNIILRCELISSSGAMMGSGIGARNVKEDDYGDLNKSLKMAQKSSHIDATLRMAGLSEIFTQDLEDKAAPVDTAPAPPPPPPAAATNPAKPWDVKLFEANCRAALAKNAKGDWAWWRYAASKRWIFPTETIEALGVPGHHCSDNIFNLDPAAPPEQHRANAAAAFAAHEEAVKAMVLNMPLEEIELAKEAFRVVSAQAPATPPTAPAPPAAKPNPYACPVCKSSATKQSQDYEAVHWCQSCGWQWDSAGKPFEAHAWLSVICPIAKKGTPKFTLGQISRQDSKRFYGLVMNNSEEKARLGRDWKGKHYEPSQEDLVFGAACDQARAYMEGAKEQGPDDSGSAAPEDGDDVPF
jgi:hypothetical protein